MSASLRRDIEQLFRETVDPTRALSRADVATAVGHTEETVQEVLESLDADGRVVQTVQDGERRWRAVVSDVVTPPAVDDTDSHEDTDRTVDTDPLIERLLDLSVAGVLLCDENGNVNRSNQRVRALLGGGADQQAATEQSDTDELTETRPWERLVDEDGAPFDPLAAGGDGEWISAVTEDGERYVCTTERIDGETSGTTRLLVTIEVRDESSNTADASADDDTDSQPDPVVSALRAAISVVAEATTRDELEAGLCQRLVETTPYHLAWVGHVSWVTETLTPTHWAAAAGEGASGAVLPPEVVLTGPAATVVGTRSVSVVPDVAVATGVDPGWQAAIQSHGYRSTVAVPFLYDQRLYGVLALYSTTTAVMDPAVDDAESVDVLADLGTAIGHALNALERRDALVSDHVAELSFRSAALAAPYRDVTGEDVVIDVENTTIIGPNESVLFITAQGIASEDLSAVFAQFPTVSRTRVVDENGTTSRFVVETVGQTPSILFATHGGRTTSIRIEGGSMRFSAEFPRSVDVREVHRALTAVFPDAELVGYRTKRREVDAVVPGDVVAAAGLTERQRTAIELAHRSGYFAWPKRRSTPKDLAATLGIAPQTFLEHLRRSEAKLVAAAFDSTSATPPPARREE
jgi:predicted DNA binding protein/PAS domain-containing protein